MTDSSAQVTENKIIPITHNTIVIGWDESGCVKYCRTFNFEHEEEMCRQAIKEVSAIYKPFIVGSVESILHTREFKDVTPDEEIEEL